jgi:hypothetical protein
VSLAILPSTRRRIALERSVVRALAAAPDQTAGIRHLVRTSGVADGLTQVILGRLEREDRVVAVAPHTYRLTERPTS